MNKLKKLGIIGLTTFLLLSSLSPKVLGSTTIEDSTFPAEVGDFFSWKCTYSHPAYYSILGDDSYQNITIDSVYRGSSSEGGFIEYALIVDVTEGRYYAGLHQYDIWQESPYIVYNKSLNHLYMEDTINPIVPIPLNLTLIADTVGDCTIDGNTITWNTDPEEHREYTFNSTGIATSWKYIENSTTVCIYRLENGNGEELAIPSGFYYILPSICAVVCLIIIVKRHNSSQKKIK